MIAIQGAVFIFTVLAIACGGALGTVLFRERRKTGIYDGIENFRRHIEALSPEARRNVVPRNVNSNDPTDNR